VTSFAGLPVVSKRVTFLIDLSGSMWNVRPDGTDAQADRRPEAARGARVPAAGHALQPDPVHSKPIPWKETLVEATPARVREAAAWFEARRENGSGNFWDAAMLALTDPDVDTLVVLFDGAPTAACVTASS
jgi:hypothetical protein